MSLYGEHRGSCTYYNTIKSRISLELNFVLTPVLTKFELLEFIS